MKISFYTKSADLNDKIKDYAREKIGKIETYLDDVREVKIELQEDKSMNSGPKFWCEVMVDLPKGRLMAHKKGESLEQAIDMIMPRLKKQIEKYKGKYKNRKSVKGVRELQK
ncbi:MAG: ribosome-associated translation inhibitor RaiA [Parcubacteria group bacterium]|nr:ribosome-associated translation inhibitor RaiA [Parcubacteria group bacterium]